MPDKGINPVSHRPMEPIAGVFGGERDTPHSVFERSRRENGWNPDRPNAGPSASARPNDLAVECPRCAAAGKKDVRVLHKDGIGAYCLNLEDQHTWKDVDVLMSLSPKRIPFKGTPARQEGFVKITLNVPGAVAEALQAKLGDKLEPTLSAVMDILSTGKSMMIGEYDLKRLSDRLGVEVANPAFLVGKIFELQQAANDAEEQVKKLKLNVQQMASRRPGMPVPTDSTVILDLGETLAPQLMEVCEKKQMKPEDYITTVIELAIAGDWI